MKAVAFAAPIHFPDMRFDALQRAMYHGEARRDGVPPRTPKQSRPYRKWPNPLALTLSGSVVADVINPPSFLVVSDAVRAVLQGSIGIEFAPVLFEHLMEFEIRLHDTSHEFTPGYRRVRPGSWFEWFVSKSPDCPELHRKTGEYFEVIVPDTRDIMGLFPNARNPDVILDPWGSPRGRFHTGRVSAAMLQEWPLLDSPYEYVARQDVFDKLESFLDPQWWVYKSFLVE